MSLTLSSCSTVVEELVSPMVATDLRNGLHNSQTNHKRTKADDKKLAKQEEQLKKEGKCPTCSGMGRTPDGQYICDTCNGTGKYEVNQ